MSYLIFKGYMCFNLFFLTDMAQLHSLIALQQFMRGLGEEMDEAELVWNIEKKKKRKERKKI